MKSETNISNFAPAAIKKDSMKPKSVSQHQALEDFQIKRSNYYPKNQFKKVNSRKRFIHQGLQYVQVATTDLST